MVHESVLFFDEYVDHYKIKTVEHLLGCGRGTYLSLPFPG